MSRAPLRCLIALAVCCSFILGRTAPSAADDAGQKVTLKLLVQAGEKWDFEATNSSKTQSTVFNGMQQQQLAQTLQQHNKGSLEVLEVKDGAPSVVRIQFAPDCSTSVSQNGQGQDTPFPLAGKTVTLRRGDDGGIVTDAGNLDPATLSELEQYLQVDRSIYPSGAVGVGDEWDGDTSNLAKQFSLGANDEAKLKCKLVAIGHAGDRKTGDVSVNGHVTKADAGTTITLGGVAQIDLITGQAIQVDLVGKLDINGQINGAQVQGGGQLEIHQTLHITSEGAGGGAPPVAGGGPAVGPPPPPNPFGDATPAPAPAPQQDESQKFIGTFKNDAISATFKSDGQGGLSGDITLGNNVMPAAGKVANGTLTGQFENNGAKFDFTATVDGDTMSLASGSKKFTLKKQSANPLDSLP